jgi:putative glutamine amidotransferase
VRRPLIGVTGPLGAGWGFWACTAAALRLAGARARRITPPCADAGVFAALDGLVIGGGADVDAALYGGEARAGAAPDPARDALELAALAAFWDGPRPVLGICRGAQLMNVFRGGGLHRDVRAAFGLRRHPRTALPLKPVRVAPDSRLRAALGAGELRVNAMHAQAVDRLGQGLRVAARDGHGMVQAIEAEGPALRLGVQWHPELMPYHRPQRRLFAALAAAARAAR